MSEMDKGVGGEKPGAEGMQGVFGLMSDTINELLRRHESEVAVGRLEQKIDQREKFFSLVSHDLRSPLAVAKMSASLIRHQLKDPKQVDSLSVRIIEAVNRAENMIKNLLDANRLQSGLAISLKPAPCDLHVVVQAAAEELSLVHGNRCRYGGRAAVPGRWDADAIRRSIDNLVTNALKYGDPQGVVSLHLGVEGDTVALSVHNFGNPIPAADAANLFRWHERTDAAKKSGQAGWGLGLMLVKGMAEAHGGSVSVQSDAESGTTFTIRLPREN